MEQVNNLHSKNGSPIGNFIFVISILLILGTTNSLFSSVNKVGLLSLFSVLGLTNLFLIQYYATKKVIYKYHVRLMALVTVYVLVGLTGLVDHTTARGFITLTQFVALLNMFIFFTLIDWTSSRLMIMRIASIIFVLFHFAIWILQGMPHPFGSIYPSNNLIGSYIYLMMFFILLKPKSKFSLLMILISLLLIYAGDSRSIFIAIAISTIVYFSWHIISKNYLTMLSFIIGVFTLIISFTFIYPKLNLYWSKFYYYDQLSLIYTGKNLHSGREEIWSQLINIIFEKPMLGHGTGILVREVLSTGVSAHNLYLQTALQNGLIGLAILIILFMFIWVSFIKNKQDRIVRLSASFFIGILFYQVFEVSLTQNQLSTGIIQWLIIAIGTSSIINRKSNP